MHVQHGAVLTGAVYPCEALLIVAQGVPNGVVYAVPRADEGDPHPASLLLHGEDASTLVPLPVGELVPPPRQLEALPPEASSHGMYPVEVPPEPREYHYRLLSLHVSHNFLQQSRFRTTHINLPLVVGLQRPPGELRQTEELYKGVRRRYFPVVNTHPQIRFQRGVYLPGRRLKLARPDHVGVWREVKHFLRHPVGYRVEFLVKILDVLVPGYLVTAVPSHDGVPRPECDETVSEDAGVQCPELGKSIKGRVRERRPGEGYSFFRMPEQRRAEFRRLPLRGLYPVGLVVYHGVPHDPEQERRHGLPPCRFIIQHDNCRTRRIRF